jgi:glucokinase
MILAGDIGGTKTLLGIFDPTPQRPRPIEVQSFPTLEFDTLVTMISRFLQGGSVRGIRLTRACFGVAGPIIGSTADLTNVPWRVDADEVARALDIRSVLLLNDLQAMAYSLPVLTDAELHVLQPGEPLRGGTLALIAAGTGLGISTLHDIDGRYVPAASEGGHGDYAARTEREVEVLRDLTSRYGRAEVEHVVSGPGLVNLHRVAHGGAPRTCPAVLDPEAADAPAAISTAALERRCIRCVEALQLFVDAYGAEAGNLALRSVATGGVFVGGGIAPKILQALTDGRFVRAFAAKPPLDHLLRRMPVKVILNADAGLLGAAVRAAQ